MSPEHGQDAHATTLRLFDFLEQNFRLAEAQSRADDFFGAFKRTARPGRIGYAEILQYRGGTSRKERAEHQAQCGDAVETNIYQAFTFGRVGFYALPRRVGVEVDVAGARAI